VGSTRGGFLAAGFLFPMAYQAFHKREVGFLVSWPYLSPVSKHKVKFFSPPIALLGSLVLTLQSFRQDGARRIAMTRQRQAILYLVFLPELFNHFARMIMTELSLLWGAKKPWPYPPKVRTATSVIPSRSTRLRYYR